MLSRRLFGTSKTHCDYVNIPTTVFTPLEYGCIGFTEEDARLIYGDSNIEVRRDCKELIASIIIIVYLTVSKLSCI